MTDAEVERLLPEQIRYYGARAASYEDLWYRRGGYDMGAEWNARWFRETAIAERAVDALDSSGSVLELACGSGLWTRRLAPRARLYVAVDASPAMLALNAERNSGPNVEFVRADVFPWTPGAGERFDLIFFGFLLSHVPPDRLAAWWAKLGSWLAPRGIVAWVDDCAALDRSRSGDRVPAGPKFAHRRRMPDGSEYTIVKIFHTRDDLAAKLDALGWDADVRGSGEHLLYGTARPR